MSTKIQLRRDSAASWASVNPILAQGEPGAETDTGKLKIGDGVTRWNLLSYVQPDADTAGTENLWLASIADCNSLHIKTSKDGLNWTRAYNPMPKMSGFGWQNAWFATPMGGKVIYDLYVDYMGTEALGWSDNATDYPKPVTFTNLPTTDPVDTYNWWDVEYLNNKYIAVGAYYKVGSTDIARPMFAYSDDGETWTYGSIDEAFTENLVGDSGGKAEGIYIDSVSWNGTGYLFSLEWDYNFGGSSLDNPPGMFYVSSLTTQLGTNNYFKPMIDNNYGLRRMTWNHDHWVALARQYWWSAPRVAFNSNTNPREGTWTVVDLNDDGPTGPQVLVFGDTTDGDNSWDAFTSGKIGSDYWDVIGHASGRVMATKDKGVTWVGSVPFNTFTSLDSVRYDGGEGSVVAMFYKPPLNSGSYTPYSGDRVEIRYSAIPALNGIFYLNTQDGSNPENWGLRLDQARTQNLPNPQAIVNGYMGSQGGDGYGGPALITFSRDAGDDLLANPFSGFGGFDSLVIADDKIVAINAHLWASSEDLNAVNSWKLSLQTDIFTVQSFGTTGLAYGSTGRTNQTSLQYVSDSDLTFEFWKELSYGYTGSTGSAISPSAKWSYEALGRYTNQLVLAENFQVDVGGSNYSNPTSMGMDGAGHWWIGYDARNNDTGSGPFRGGEWGNTTAIMNSDELYPGYDDVVIATDLFNNNDGPYNWLFDRYGVTHFPNYNFPSAHGTANQVLKDDGNGNLTWSNMSGGGSVGDLVITGTTISAAPGGETTPAPTVTGLEWGPSGHTGTYVVTIGTQVNAITYHTKVKFHDTGVTGLDGNTFYLSPISYGVFGIYTDWATSIPLDASGFSAWSSGGYVKVLAPGQLIKIQTGVPGVDGSDPGGIEFQIGGKTYGWTIDRDNHLRSPADGDIAKIKNYYGHDALFTDEVARVTQVHLSSDGHTSTGQIVLADTDTKIEFRAPGGFNFVVSSWKVFGAVHNYSWGGENRKTLTVSDLIASETSGQNIAIASTPPAHSYGAAGDTKGMIAFDSDYIYYCTANYVNTSTDIWKRVALDATAW